MTHLTQLTQPYSPNPTHPTQITKHKSTNQTHSTQLTWPNTPNQTFPTQPIHSAVCPESQILEKIYISYFTSFLRLKGISRTIWTCRFCIWGLKYYFMPLWACFRYLCYFLNLWQFWLDFGQVLDQKEPT